MGAWYLLTSLFWWVVAAFALGAFVGWRSCRQEPRLEGWGWLLPGLAIFALGLVLAVLKAVPGRLGLYLDMALLFSFFYIVGCLLGCLFGRKEDAIPIGAAAGTAVAAAPVAAARVAAAPAPVVRSAPTIRPYQWQAAREPGAVTLTGYVPSDSVRNAIVGNARTTLAPAAVVDKLQIGAGAPANLEGMAGAAFGHLNSLDRGIASLIDSRYTLTGVAGTRNAYDRVMADVKALPSGFGLAKVDIVAPPAPVAAPTPVAPAPVAAPTPVAPAPVAPAAPETAAPVAALAPVEPANVAAVDAGIPGRRPLGLAGPRGGKADDLKLIRGIGRQNEGRLHGLGVWHFDQIAAWSADESLWVGSYLAFPGRIEREEWVSQAKVLAAGGKTAFAERVARGEVATSKDDGSLGQDNVERVSDAGRPEGLAAPRGGKGDDLKLINGVGRAIEQRLHEIGIWHFDQIAAMTPAELDWISARVGFPGRAIRENWKGEADILAKGGETDHSRAVRAGKIPTSLDEPPKEG
jgi:predicted flap endonuclease-1-like 5' DNA nuclease